MGLLSALVTLPLAPVRGVVWLAEQIEHEAERQWRDPAVIRQELERIEAAYQNGELDDAQRDRLQDALVARLLNAGPTAPGIPDGFG